MKMKKRIRFFLFPLVMLFVILPLSSTVVAAQAPVNLRSTSTFAVLAGTTITNTGTTVIQGDAGGDVGVSPGSAITEQPDITIINGAFHSSDTAANTAQTDLGYAYDDAAGRPDATSIPSELGGQTLKPGVYKSDNGTSFQITGTLTLDGNGEADPVFIFQMASTLITATSSKVILENGAVYCRVFWQVGSSATLEVDSQFVGHIFALTSITVKTNATVQGQLLARNGAVTLDNNTITNGFCAAAAAATPTPTATSTPTTAPGATAVPTTAPGATAVPTTAPGATAVPTTAPGATAVPTTAAGVTPVPTTGTTELTKTGENTQKQIMIGGLLLVISGSLVFLLVSRRKNIQR